MRGMNSWSSRGCFSNAGRGYPRAQRTGVQGVRIKEYMVITDDNTNDLANQVNANIREGWQPFGGVSCSPPTEQNIEWYAQAMVKYGKQ